MTSRWIPRRYTLTSAAVLLLLSVEYPSFAAGTEELENALEPSADCLACHLFQNLPTKADEPMYAPGAYQGTMMANASRDPVFWAGVAIAHQDHPAETPLCIRCHSPRAYFGGRANAIAYSDLAASDHDGVSCDLCHRMIRPTTGHEGNGNYLLDDTLVGTQVPKAGPFDYAAPNVPKHPWRVDDGYLKNGEFCGTCHDVTTPRERVDIFGEPLGSLFNEQRTFSEWRNSDYSREGGQTCQDCHLPDVLDAGGSDTFNTPSLAHKVGVRRHDLVGANVEMLTILRTRFGSSGSGDVEDGFFDLSLARSREFLGTSAQLDVVVPDELDLAEGGEIEVRVTNKTGHKLPTGYSEGRIMWIELELRANETTLFSSGHWGENGLVVDEQLRTYEGHAIEFASGESFHLLNNDTWIEDTRIPPEGLIVGDIETDPVGERYEALADGTWPHYDNVIYTIPTMDGGAAGLIEGERYEATLNIRLRYVINTPEYLDFLEAENLSNGSGASAKAAYSELGEREPVVLAKLKRPLWVQVDKVAPTSTSVSVFSSDADSTSNPPVEPETAGCGCRLSSKPRWPVGSGSSALILLLIAGFRFRTRRSM